MPSRRTLMAATPAVIFLAAACGRFSTPAGGPGGDSGFAAGAAIAEVFPAADRVAPGPVTGELLDGTAFDLATLRGTVVVLNFWASWCAPCRVETEHLVAAYAATKDLGVSFVGVNVRDDRDKAVAFAESFDLNYPSLYDPGGRVGLSFSQTVASAIPFTVILDRAGRAAAVFRKAVQQDELETVVRQVAAEDGPARG